MSDNRNQYETGDAVAVHVGIVELKDGRIFRRAVILTFPAGPPDLPFSVVWDGTPLTLSLKAPKPTKEE